MNKSIIAGPVSSELDFASDNALSGFRLQKLEVFNWGTFNDQVWSLNLDGKNSLLTGDIGSGKSTLVDAVTTLLVPANKVDYNKAAGAEKKERHLRSYVLGYYKSERNESSGKSRPVPLRDQNNYSVILGVFHNQGYDQTVTLAQVFWMKELQGQPERFYVCTEKALSIKQNFAQFGKEIKSLRKRLRKEGCEVMDHFPQYGAWFRRRFGIDNDQALDLFHQTVSMKSVGNLTEFVRGHMLEPFDVSPRIHALIEHFDDLNRAHEAVLKARRQIESLTPLVSDCDQHQQQNDALAKLRQSREALTTYFTEKKLQLLEERLQRLQMELTRQQNKVQSLTDESEQQRNQQQELKKQIADNGGDRIERLQQEIRQQQVERQRRSDKAARYQSLLEHLALDAAKTVDAFIKQQQTLQQKQEQLKQQQTEHNNQQRDVEFNFLRKKEEHQELKQNIIDLKSRKSNIDQIQVNIRQQLCEALALDEADLPFAGELLQVREEDKTWQGAIERLLHNFGLSLLVPDEHYSRVAQWVDETHLRGRLVYYRVRETHHKGFPSLHKDSLVHKISIKPDSAFYAWLEQEVAIRFDVACCESQQQFRREKRAITRNGQIKSNDGRHEKDDRFALNDRSRFVLGWSNKDKIAALENNARQLQRIMAAIGPSISKLKQQENQLKETLGAISKLEEYRDFQELDWQPLALRIAEMQNELQELESTSDLLQTLTHQLKELESKQSLQSQQLSTALEELGSTKQKIDTANELRNEAHTITISEEAEQNRPWFDNLDLLRPEALGEHKLTVAACDTQQQEMRKWLQGKMDAVNEKITRLQGKIVKTMSDYKRDYSLETQDVDAAVEAADEYRQMLIALQADDLPRFEARFKELLNENTIREVANFQSQLHRERETIKERIAQINKSLTQIDYNPARFIKLEAELTQDADIRDFQSELRTCTEGALTGSEDEQYSETKFLQVRHIIERFRGREGLSDQDKRWTAKVTDVRNWFTFAASERWREDNSEHEHYSDSGGKSGGQKEKLAYTILAASLAYQFGLEWGAVRSRSFRFVVIDEAFGRGSDESAQYGLKLFQQLNLQLLIVTPLQKIHIIEPHVASVGFVHNEDGRTSKLRNLSIEAYHQEKAQLHGQMS
ncbi:MAG: hypothetical protein ACI909_000632 [Planctomycetota bacterium]